MQALVSDKGYAAGPERYKLRSPKVCSETGEIPHAQLVFTDEGVEKKAGGTGSGPVDATFKALESVVNSGAAANHRWTVAAAERAGNDSHWDSSDRSEPEIEFDQRFA